MMSAEKERRYTLEFQSMNDSLKSPFNASIRGLTLTAHSTNRNNIYNQHLS
jgi:hypothetical protein